MSTLSLYLPPFASDYVGAASALFDLDCLVAINDGSCCTAHFASYDEPRWNTGRKQTLCTNLRMNDTVFGIDERIVQQLGQAARDLGAKRIITLGTPVPAVIGTDMEGLAAELEYVTGIPSFGIDTTGFSTYVSGICKAFDLMLNMLDQVPQANNRKPFVNVLGMTPLDLSIESDRQLDQLLASEGIPVGVHLFMGACEDTLELLPHAVCNVAVSYAGLLMAQNLQKRFGTPYISCSFTASQEASKEFAAMRALIAGKELEPHKAACDPSCAPKKRVLAVGDQVVANSLRQALLAADAEYTQVVVASFFGLSERHAQPGDVFLPTEAHLIQHLKQNNYDAIVGDPLLARIPDVSQRDFIPLAHPAISSRLHRGQEPCAGRFDLDAIALRVLGK